MPSRKRRGEHGDSDNRDSSTEPSVDVGVQVRVFPGTDREASGTVVEDFGDEAGHAVLIGEQQIASGARRWAVATSEGSLVFVDDDDIAVATG